MLLWLFGLGAFFVAGDNMGDDRLGCRTALLGRGLLDHDFFSYDDYFPLLAAAFASRRLRFNGRLFSLREPRLGLFY